VPGGFVFYWGSGFGRVLVFSIVARRADSGRCRGIRCLPGLRRKCYRPPVTLPVELYHRHPYRARGRRRDMHHRCRRTISRICRSSPRRRSSLPGGRGGGRYDLASGHLMNATCGVEPPPSRWAAEEDGPIGRYDSDFNAAVSIRKVVLFFGSSIGRWASRRLRAEERSVEMSHDQIAAVKRTSTCCPRPIAS